MGTPCNTAGLKEFAADFLEHECSECETLGNALLYAAYPHSFGNAVRLRHGGT